MFIKKGLVFDLNLIKKVFEQLTKNQKEEEYINIFMYEIETKKI